MRAMCIYMFKMLLMFLLQDSFDDYKTVIIETLKIDVPYVP